MKPKIVTLLLLVFIFGIPALVTIGLLTTGGRALAVSDAKQPGGSIEGVVVGPDGEPLSGMEVTVHLARESGGLERVATLTTDAAGEFRGTVPPHEGHYLVESGGGTWRATALPFSLVDREGNPRELPPLELELEPGCHLVLELVDASGKPMGDGKLRVEGSFASPYLFGLLDGNLSSSRSIRAGRVELEGLPAPMDATIHVSLDSGESAELQLELEPGRRLERVEF